jgi:MFS family permease
MATADDKPGGRRLRGNVWRYYVFKTLWGLGGGFIVPVWVLYFLDRGILLGEFMVLISLMNLSMVVLEVPTGIVADRFSRKWSNGLGKLILGISVLTILLVGNGPILVAAFLLWGLGESLVSGADSALLYDSLKADGREDAFRSTIGRVTSLTLVAVVVGTVLCGQVIDAFGLSGPLWFFFGAMLLSGAVIVTSVEPPFLQEARDQSQNPSLRGHTAAYLRHLRESFRFVLNSKALLVLVLINIVVLRMSHLTERPFAQPYLTAFGYDPEAISYVHAIFYLITALSALFSSRIGRLLRNGEHNAMLLIGSLGIASLIVMVNAPAGTIVIGAMSGVYLMRGVFYPFIENSLNRRLESEKRASCLSIAKMGNNFLGIFLGPLFGYLADELSLDRSLEIFQWTFVPLLLLCVVLAWRVLREGNDPEPQAYSETPA